MDIPKYLKRSNKMTVLSIDPAWAKPMAYAVFDDGQLVYHGKFTHTRELFVTKADFVVTEDPYLGGNAIPFSNNKWVNSFKQLCFAVGMIALMAQAMEADFKLIRPVDWKSFYELTKKTPPSIQETIRAQLTGGVLDEDIQDAILIGTYYIDHVMVGAGI